MHSFTHNHKETESSSVQETETRGIVMNWGWRFDLVMGLTTLGREGTYRRRVADMAQLQPGEAVLDVGCGTGSLALVAKERVGAAGRVCGIDPGPKQIARARYKAARRRLSVDFQVGVIEQLAFADCSFDVVLSTLMMHHLPDDLKRQGLAEIARVLKPGGRLLVVDMRGQMGAGHSGTQDLPALMQEAGFLQIETGKADLLRLSLVDLLSLSFVLGRISKAEKETPSTSRATSE